MARISQWLDPLIAPSPKSSASAPKVSQSQNSTPNHTAGAERAVATGQPQLSNLFRARASRRLSVGLTVPVPDGQNSRWIVGMTIAADAIGDMLLAQHLAPSWTAVVVDRTGVVVARSRSAAAFVGKPATEQVRVRLAIRRIRRMLTDRRRARAQLRPQPDGLRPVALRPCAGAHARRTAQRRAVQELGAARRDRARAPQARRGRRRRPPDGRDSRRGTDRRPGCGRGRLRSRRCAAGSTPATS